MDVFTEICALLDRNGVSYDASTHAPARTSQEAAAIRGVHIKTGAKAMLIRSEGAFTLFILSAEDKMDFKKIKEILGTKSTTLATSEEVERITHCVPGCVPPFGSLFGTTTYVDEHLLEIPEINFSAGRLTHSIHMKTEDWKRIEKPFAQEFCDKR